MSIRNAQAFVDSIWDWGFLDSCFGKTKIKVSDVDGIAERNGKFLFIETKGDSVPVPLGQKIMHDNLLKTNIFSVIILWGEANKTISKIKLMHQGLVIEEHNISFERLKELVAQWFAWANSSK